MNILLTGPLASAVFGHESPSVRVHINDGDTAERWAALLRYSADRATNLKDHQSLLNAADALRLSTFPS